jgi:hypothetical protein
VTTGGGRFVPRDRPHGFEVTSVEPARALIVVGPARLDSQVAAAGVQVAPPGGDQSI